MRQQGMICCRKALLLPQAPRANAICVRRQASPVLQRLATLPSLILFLHPPLGILAFHPLWSCKVQADVSLHSLKHP
eukprot:scaffold30405_cov15-Tisochrysis_lutea.AAC.1